MFIRFLIISCVLMASYSSFAEETAVVEPAKNISSSSSPFKDQTASQTLTENGDEVKKTEVRNPQFENDRVRVWKSTITVDQDVQMHRHNTPKIIVALKGGLLHRIEQTGAVSDMVFDTGKAYWLDADPPNELHADINPSHESVELMVIEFKEP